MQLIQQFDANEVKEMRKKMEDFGSMVGEIINTFLEIDSIDIKDINIAESNNNNLMMIDIPKKYLDIVINARTGKVFDRDDIIIDLLQSALNESGIVDKNEGIDATFKKFLTTNKISYIHNMVGSTEKNLITKFDNFIDSEKNYELTFKQKLNKFKK